MARALTDRVTDITNQLVVDALNDQRVTGYILGGNLQIHNPRRTAEFIFRTQPVVKEPSLFTKTSKKLMEWLKK